MSIDPHVERILLALRGAQRRQADKTQDAAKPERGGAQGAGGPGHAAAGRLSQSRVLRPAFGGAPFSLAAALEHGSHAPSRGPLLCLQSPGARCLLLRLLAGAGSARLLAAFRSCERDGERGTCLREVQGQALPLGPARWRSGTGVARSEVLGIWSDRGK